MKKNFFILLPFLTIYLTACSNNSLQNNTETELETMQEQESYSTVWTEQEPSSNETSDVDDCSWNFIVNNYPLVTYDEIKTNNFNGQYVIISATIDTVEYFASMNWVDCDVWFLHENSYIRNSITLQCDELISYSPKSLQPGDNIDICFFINVDSSFGFNIKGFNPNDNSISLEDIHNSFKQNCSPMDWENVMRNPDELWGTTYFFTGTVFQVISEQDNRTELLISTDKDKYIHVSYIYKDSESKVLENDTLIVYGTFYKIYKYTSVLGTNQRVPSIVAEFIDIN
ncbi:MAG: hypothetical protein HDR08_01565 [Lachnospiraceae bacterium]|nr:hypothetical protein [Lachnospiraceae bacterium]